MIEWEIALGWEAETAWEVLEIDIPHLTIEVDIKRVKMNVDMAEEGDTIDPLQFTGKIEVGSEKGRDYGNTIERSPDTRQGDGLPLCTITMTGGGEEEEEQ